MVRFLSTQEKRKYSYWKGGGLAISSPCRENLWSTSAYHDLCLPDAAILLDDSRARLVSRLGYMAVTLNEATVWKRASIIGDAANSAIRNNLQRQSWLGQRLPIVIKLNGCKLGQVSSIVCFDLFIVERYLCQCFKIWTVQDSLIRITCVLCAYLAVVCVWGLLVVLI